MKIKKKLASKAGESITEALAAVLVLVLGFMIVAGAVSAAARVTEGIKNEKISSDLKNIKRTQETEITVSMSGMDDPVTASVDLYETNGGYYYYEVKEFKSALT